MLRSYQKLCVLMLVGTILLFPVNSTASEQTTLSAEEYSKQFQAYLETYIATPALIATWEDCLVQHPEDNQLRYYLVFAYTDADQYDRAKACAKEALLYEPDSALFAHMYMLSCDQDENPDEMLEAAEYVLKITLPLLPPIGQAVDGNRMEDINNYSYLEYSIDAAFTLQNLYAERGEEKKMLQYSDWILLRKDDSDLGYRFGLISMYALAVYYARARQFNEMEYWLDQYLTFEATSENKGEDWEDMQEHMQLLTDFVKEIYDVYLQKGDEMDIDTVLQQSAECTV